MAVTRINNNQITDAVQGNVYVGINANTKIQNFSITAGKIANNLTYGSDLTIAGNLTVQGNSTAIDTTITTIEDPVIVLASTQTGAPAVDIGFIGERGTSENIAFVWDESAQEFATVYTDTSETNTTVNITGYANAHVGNMVVGGTTSLAGNVIGAANFTGNVTGGNLLTAGLISATGNVTGGNVTTGGVVSATSNVIGGNITTVGQVSATGNVTGGNIIAGNAVIGNINVSGDIAVNSLTANTYVSAIGNVQAGNVLTNGLISAAGTVTGGNLATGGTVSAVGNATFGNVSTTNYTGTTVSVSGTITAGNLATGGTVSATGNATVGNLLTGGQVSATGNITTDGSIELTAGGRILTAGNIIGGNLVSRVLEYSNADITIRTTGNVSNINLSPTGNIVVNNTYINGLQLTPVQDADAASKYYVDTIATTGITIHEAVLAATISNLAVATGGTVTYAQPNGVANGIGATLTTTGTYTTIDTANVQTVGTRILVKDQANAVQNGVYVYSNSTVITRSTDTDQYGADSAESFSINDYFFTTSGNVNAGTAFIVNAPPGVITFGTSNIGFGIFSQSQVYSANTSAGLILNGTIFSAKVDNNTTAFDGGGNISVKPGANLTTPNIGAATGTSLSVTGTVTAASTVGGVITGSSASVTGNVTGGNILTSGSGGAISGTGNITGGNILSSGLGSFTGNVTAANFIGNIVGNVDAAGANTQVQFNDTGDILGASAGFTFDKTANLLTVNGNVNATNFNGNVYGTSVSASGTVTAASTVGGVITGSSASVTGNITGGNITTAGALQGGNIVISGDDITDTNGRVNFNTAGADVDFAVNGDTVANVFYVDAGTGTASFGNAVQTVNSVVAFNSTTSIRVPVGNAVQRPTGVTGQFRFNTTQNTLEVYDNTQWVAVGQPEFTVIADEQFNGDGSTVAFTLDTTQTTNSCIVSINGVVQIPILAYAVAGTDPTCVLTFTEAPQPGDIIDVREITTTTSVISIANSSGNAVIAVSDTSKTITMTGDLEVTGNVSVLGNIATDQVLNGTSRIEIPDPNGNIHFDINSANDIMNIGQFNVVFTSNVKPAANVTYDLGSTTQRWKDLYLANSTIYLGNAQISANATAIVMTNPAGGQTVLAGATTSSSVAGNITGGNLTTAGILTVNSGGAATAIVNGAGNAVGNIGSASNYFNTVFAKATSAQYADLAEKYVADAEYAPGTVLVFGGTAEVTVDAVEGDTKVAGVVSTNPSYTMNSGLAGEHVATVALTGRVPTMVIGPVRKGDLMVAAGLGRAKASVQPKVGSVIGKALEDFDGAEGTIEVVVGRF